MQHDKIIERHMLQYDPVQYDITQHDAIQHDIICTSAPGIYERANFLFNERTFFVQRGGRRGTKKSGKGPAPNGVESRAYLDPEP